jgi:prefoldin subunit 5
MYDLQIETLTQQTALLKETQYDRALSLIKSQKELFNNERQALTTRIASLTQSGESASNEANALKQQL